MAACFGHVTNWYGGGERAGPRNDGNYLATAVEFLKKQNDGNAPRNAQLLLSIVRCEEESPFKWKFRR